MQLASEFEIVVAYLSSNNHVFIIESILDKLMSDKDSAKKPISLHIYVKKDFKVDHFKEIFYN